MKKFLLFSFLAVLVAGFGEISSVNAVSIPGTTGEGTENNPIVVDTFDELKQAMESSSIEYITLESTNETLPQILNTDSSSAAIYAIKVSGTKHLELDGNSTFTEIYSTETRSDGEDMYESYGSFILVKNGNKLYVDGDGSLKYKLNNNANENAVISNQGGTIVINGGTLEGSFNAGTTCYAIHQSNGRMDINGGTFIGTAADELHGYDVAGVYIYGGTANINGGDFSSNEVAGDGEGYGLFVRGGSSVSLYGGTFEGIDFQYPGSKTLSDLLGENCRYMKNGNVFDASSVNGDSIYIKTKDTLTVSTSKFVINEIKITAYEPAAGNKPQKPISNTNYVEVNSYVWSNGNSSNFVAGDDVTLTVDLKPMNGNQFDNNVRVYINGESATITEHSASHIICKVDYKVKTEDQTIFVINTSVENPTAGKDLPTPNVTTNTVTDVSYEWSPSGTAQAGKTYRLTVLAHRTAGYKFSNNTQPRIGANDAVVDSYKEDYIKYHWDFTVASDSPNLNRVDVTITEPTAGAKPDMNPKVSADANYKITKVRWDDYDTDETVNSNDTFVKGRNYTVYVTVTPISNDYQFTSNPTAYFNTSIKGGSVKNPDGSVDVYKKFKAGDAVVVTKYTVKFDTNGGSSVASQEVEENAKATKPSTPTKEGYTFDNWYSNSSLTKEFDFDTKITSNVTIYAKWNKNEAGTYTVTFDLDGGKMSSASSVSVKDGEKVSKPSKDPTKDDYKFEGWYSNSKLTKQFDFDAKITENTTIYAKWTSTKTEVKENENKDNNKEEIKDSEKKDNTEVKDTEKKDTENKDNTEKKVYNNGFSDEFNEAYEFAFKNGITTIDDISKANMNGGLTRIAMAKMLSNYAINVLGKTPDTSKTPSFKDVPAQLDADYNNGVTLAYQLGIMGINMKDNMFRPNDDVTRAEFGTALSRMLYNLEDGSDKYYSTHLAKLKAEGIISNDNPEMKEVRGYVMIMLMRSAK